MEVFGPGCAMVCGGVIVTLRAGKGWRIQGSRLLVLVVCAAETRVNEKKCNNDNNNDNNDK